MDCVIVYMETPNYELSEWDVQVACRSVLKVGMTPFLFTNVPEKFAGEKEWIVVPMSKTYTGWWCMIEAYRYLGPCLACGVDTVFVKSPSGLIQAVQEAEDHTVFMHSGRGGMRFPPTSLYHWASGLVGRAGEAAFVYEEFWRNPEAVMNGRMYRRIARTGLRAEDDFTADMFLRNGWNVRSIHDVQKGIYSAVWQLPEGEEMPEETSVLFFNGKARLKKEMEKHAWLPNLVNEILS